MNYHDKGRYLNYLLKQIQQEKYIIEKDSQEVSNLIDELIEELKEIKRGSEEISSGVITHYSYATVQGELHKIFFRLQEINFRKQNIRNYKNEIFSINSFFVEDWE